MRASPPPWRFSKFVHPYRRRGQYALYHALTMDVAYLDEELGRQIVGVRGRPTSPVPDDIVRALTARRFLAADDAFDAGLLGEYRRRVGDNCIKMLCIVLTTRCNYACRYCHLRNIPAPRAPSLPTDITAAGLRAGLRLFARYAAAVPGPKDVLLYGGEPLLVKARVRQAVADLKEHAAEFNGRVNVQLITNGRLLDESFARYAKANGVFLIVSLDGLGADNDKARHAGGGASAFRIADRALTTLKKVGCRFGISITIGTHNIDTIQDSLGAMLDAYGPVDIGLNSSFHPINGRTNAYQVDSRTAAATLIACFDVARRKGFYAEQLFRRVRPFIEQTPRLKDCSSCGGRLVLTPYGTIGVCDSFAFTNEFSAPIAGFDLAAYRDYDVWKGISPVNMAACLRCPAVTLCGGGCRYDAYYQSKLDIHGLDAYRCEQAKLILEWLIWDLYAHLRQPVTAAEPLAFPTEAERRALRGAVALQPNAIPMSASNTYGERA